MQKEILKKARILIVDDEHANVRYLELTLEDAGYDTVIGTTKSADVLRLFHDFSPDIVLLDLYMPRPDGFEVMQQLEGAGSETDFVPILVLTADTTTETKQRALDCGAQDFITKPLDTVEVLLRIKNLLNVRMHSRYLQTMVRDRTIQLEMAQLETLMRLALAAEYRDDDTGKHTRRVGYVSSLIAQAMSLPGDQVQHIEQTAPLHDVGKIGIPDAILLKPGRLTESEYELVKGHCTIGARILSGSGSEWLQLAEVIALNHHERWDGHGYPSQLSGEDIPLVGRIVAVADVFDALTHNRPYKGAWSVQEAVDEVARQSGSQFDPAVVVAFMTLPHNKLV